MHQSMKKHCNASHHFSWTPCLENEIAQASQETYSKQVVLIGPLFEICVPSLLTNILLGALISYLLFLDFPLVGFRVGWGWPLTSTSHVEKMSAVRWKMPRQTN